MSIVHSSSQSPVRVRFAPSPTGFLHIGGVRAALFNWLYARHHGGQFILRIEDTDLERSEQRYTDDILASMRWLGLSWDEEPLYQSQRLGIYKEKAEQLVRAGHAYRCVCTEAQVEQMREQAMSEGKKPQYDRRCRARTDIGVGQPHVIRAKIPLEGGVEFLDLIRGTIRVENSEIDDFVLIRSNGAPTYNLSNVVDDVHSRMTHVIRGDDHINNTPKQLHLYRALNYPVPAFAHLPMILGPDKKKLSKRHGAVSVNTYREEGYLPEALLNFLARLGWSHGDQEFFTQAEMIQFFSFDHVQKSSGVFNVEKLQWLNGAHLRAARPERLQEVMIADFSNQIAAAGPNAIAELRSPLGAELVALIAQKVKLTREIAEQLIPLLAPSVPTPSEQERSSLKFLKSEATRAGVAQAIEVVLTQWTNQARALNDSQALRTLGITHEQVDQTLRQAGEKTGVKLGDIAQPLRLMVTGRTVSAGLFELIAVLPWERIRPRLQAALELARG